MFAEDRIFSYVESTMRFATIIGLVIDADSTPAFQMEGEVDSDVSCFP
jgi:hypothetical protein